MQSSSYHQDGEIKVCWANIFESFCEFNSKIVPRKMTFKMGQLLLFSFLYQVISQYSQPTKEGILIAACKINCNSTIVNYNYTASTRI